MSLWVTAFLGFFWHYQREQLPVDGSLPVEEEIYCRHAGSLPATYVLQVRNTKPQTGCLELQVVFLTRSVTLKNCTLNKHLKKSKCLKREIQNAFASRRDTRK